MTNKKAGKLTIKTVTNVATLVTNPRQINQGDIIKFNFSPTKGHEQADYRPALVLSAKDFHKINGLIWVLPITNKMDDFPGHVELGETTLNVVSGNILCEHIRSIDPISRKVKIVDKASKETLEKCIRKVIASIAIEAGTKPYL